VRIFRNCDPRSLVSVHRADFLPRNTRTTRKKRIGPSVVLIPWSSFPCVRCVPWLTTEQIFYHGILGPHGKREQVLPSPHALVFISVCSVCSVVDHRADFLPRNTRTTRKKRTGPPQSSCPGLHSVCSVCSVVDHRANFLPRNTRTTRKKRTGLP
jgi:hypothetical protein